MERTEGGFGQEQEAAQDSPEVWPAGQAQLKLKASTVTLFESILTKTHFVVVVTSSSVCWKEKGIHLDRSSICILIIAQLRS